MSVSATVLRTVQPAIRAMGRLSVGRKLLLIYLLDLMAVIFISGILIHEKFIAIDFARKELVGAAYLREVAGVMIGTTEASVAPLARLREVEVRHGELLQTQRLPSELERAVVQSAADPNSPVLRLAAIAAGADLMRRVGNQSNLILDPDLDSYYTMSLVLLRFPELLDVVLRTQALRLAPAAAQAEARSQAAALVGRLQAAHQGIASDAGEAYAAAQGPTRVRLEPALQALLAQARRFEEEARGDPQRPLDTRALVAALSQAWRVCLDELDVLLQARIDRHFQRMWWHLGTALGLLLTILTVVFFVARQITRPLQQLTALTDRVSRSGDHSLRAHWDSADEIGVLVRQFNLMLEQLGRQRMEQQELAATARAALAQQRLVEDLPVPLMVTAVPGHEVLHANTPARDWLMDSDADPWARGLSPPARARFFQELADRGFVNEFRVQWSSARGPQWTLLSARRLSYQGRDAVVTAFTPIARQMQLEARLQLWAKVFADSSESILILDAQRRIVSGNAAFARDTRHELNEVIGQVPDFLLQGGGAATASLPMWHALQTRGAWQGEVTLCRRDQSTYPAWMVASAVRGSDGVVTHFIFSSVDISERKSRQAQIDFLAHHDVLTGLPNRALFVDRLRQAIQQARRQQHRVAVLFIDLDRFKTINDSLGHAIGDALLKSVAQRLQESVREGDTVSRLGGDEFVVSLAAVRDTDEVLSIVEHRLIPQVRAPHRVGETELHVSCSVGIAVFPDDAGDQESLMRHADVAMYQAKALGRDGAQFFKPELNERAHRRLRIENALRQALARQELSLRYQPILAASDGALMGVEALLRWDCPELGPMSPAEFIGIAEESRLIVPIGAWVLEQACRQQVAWQREGLGRVRVSVNVSAVQLRDAGWIDSIRGVLQHTGADPHCVEIELTESALMTSVAATQRQLDELKALGVGLAVDDFGTGYSSLNYLSRFPIDRLKVDQSFVRDLLSDERSRAITHAMIGLGHALGITVVAEGVESEPIARHLREAGCDALQGYFYSRPLPASQVPDFVRAVVTPRPREAPLGVE